MKKIMIIHSVYTGHGHKSISDALVEQLKKYDDVEVEVVDGFSLIGKAALEASKFYGPMTRRAKDLWRLTYTVANQNAQALETMISSLIHDRFMKKLIAFTPDLIVTVHAMFTTSVLNLLEHYHLKIPFVTLQADIINIHKAWCNPRATLTLCPTEEAMESSLMHGMPKSKLKVCGFPTRERFCEVARRSTRPDYQEGHTLECILMSGGEGSGNMLKYAEVILKHVHSNLRVICGRNLRLKQALEDALLDKYPGRVRIYGFVDDLQDIMSECDLVIARGSPNTLMEAVVLNVPVLITGSLPGQEADNPALMVSHNLGVVCENPESAPAIISALMRDGGKRLAEIRAAQRAYRNLDNAKNTAQLLYDMAVPSNISIPRYRQKIQMPLQTRYTLRKMKKQFRRMRRPQHEKYSER